MHTVTLDSIDLDRLERLSQCMAQTLPAKLVIGLVGTLGAGKTTFTQTLAAATGVDPEDVTSPTFTLLCSYDASIAAGPIQLHHLDTYRLADEDEFLELGVEEFFESDHTWVLIEWADRVESVMPVDTLWMTIDVCEGDADAPPRTIKLSTRDDRLADALGRLRDAMSAA